MSAAKIAPGKVVLFHYTLRDAEGTVIDSSAGRDPLPYLHGFRSIVPGLERQMEGRSPGDKFDATVPAAEGYGERQTPAPQPVPRAHFPEDLEIEAGMQFMAQEASGRQVPIWVVKVSADEVWIDRDHPMAGKTLHFSVEVIEVRDATSEEAAHGHVHGPGAHHH
jgi:FKBP-type peptidyl-prolyl cis-trans isomerase SlyD